MGANVTMLNGLLDVIRGLNMASADLYKTADRMSTANRAVVDQIRTPLGKEKAWRGVGQPDAVTVVDVNGLAMRTAELRISQGAKALGDLSKTLGAASSAWRDMWDELADDTLQLSEDGTVAVRAGEGPLGADRRRPEDLTARIKTILSAVDAADKACSTELKSMDGKVPPTTSTAASGLLDTARNAYDDAEAAQPKPKPWHLADQWKGSHLIGSDGERYLLTIDCDEAGWYTVEQRNGYDQLLPNVGADTVFALFMSPYGPVVSVDKLRTKDRALAQIEAKAPPGAEAPVPYRFRERWVTGKDGTKHRLLEWAEDDTAPRYRAYQRGQAGADAVVALGEAALRASKANDHTYFGWEATFQKNVDGDTRVLFKTYQVMNGPNGSFLVEKYMTIDENGEPVFVDPPKEEGTWVGPSN